MARIVAGTDMKTAHLPIGTLTASGAHASTRPRAPKAPLAHVAVALVLNASDRLAQAHAAGNPGLAVSRHGFECPRVLPGEHHHQQQDMTDSSVANSAAAGRTPSPQLPASRKLGTWESGNL